MPLWEYCSLRHTEQGLVVSIYRAKRFTTTLVYQGNDTNAFNTALTNYITRLGSLGWQAMHLPGDEKKATPSSALFILDVSDL